MESKLEEIVMIQITKETISPEQVVARAKTNGSGCVVTYVGLIRDNSHGKPVLSVEYQDSLGNAEKALQIIADEARKRWQLEDVAISHRIGKLRVGDINLVVAVASAHRGEGFAACQFIIDRFKESLPTRKTETYRDGGI
jgi:molybdopterin synthase catalytic subunit